jgi:hypothetical protein
MRVRNWQEILDRVAESGADAGGWRAIAGDRRRGVGEDLYLGHPAAGVFQIKTYAKNPYEVRGVGAEIARKIDDDLDPLFPEEASGRFGVQRPIEEEADAERAATRLESVLETHRDAPTTPDALFEDVMGALDSPAYGPMEYDAYDRPDAMTELAERFEEAESLLEADLADLVEEDEVGRGFD